MGKRKKEDNDALDAVKKGSWCRCSCWGSHSYWYQNR